MEKMKELYAKVAGDVDLQAKFVEIMKNAAEAGEATNEKLISFAREAGYEISFEEVREYYEALSGQKEGELSDAELDAVAGGKSAQGGGYIALSVLTVGTGCAAGSIIAVIKSGVEACLRIFD